MKQTPRRTPRTTPTHSTPSSLTESTIHDTWKGLPDSQIRARGLRLARNTLTRLIPHGPYCYTVIGPLPSPQIGHRIRPCMFLRGMRPDTICLINPVRDFRRDLFNLDACKRCGVNDHEGDEIDAGPSPQSEPPACLSNTCIARLNVPAA